MNDMLKSFLSSDKIKLEVITEDSEKNRTEEIKEFHDDETLLLTLSLNKPTKIKAGALKKILKHIQDNYVIDFEDEDSVNNGYLDEYLLFLFMLRNLFEFSLEELITKYDSKNNEFVFKPININSIEEFYEFILKIVFSETSDILHSLSPPLKIERVPSNYSMITCPCCMPKTETKDKNDFSKDDFVNKNKAT